MLSTRAAKATLGGMIVGLALLASVAFGGGPAHAQSNCEPRASLVAKLDKGFGEQPIAIGLASTGNVLEVLISVDGTWTILITSPNGLACIAATGEHWQTRQKIKPAGETS
jgi:hypothetical protein